MVCGIIGHPEVIEIDHHAAEGHVKMRMIAFRHLPGGDLLLLCADDNGGAMVVRTADEYHPLPGPPQVPDIEVCGNIGSQVPDMTGAIGIRQAAGHQYGLLTHHYTFDGDAINK